MYDVAGSPALLPSFYTEIPYCTSSLVDLIFAVSNFSIHIAPRSQLLTSVSGLFSSRSFQPKHTHVAQHARTLSPLTVFMLRMYGPVTTRSSPTHLQKLRSSRDPRTFQARPANVLKYGPPCTSSDHRSTTHVPEPKEHAPSHSPLQDLPPDGPPCQVGTPNKPYILISPCPPFVCVSVFRS